MRGFCMLANAPLLTMRKPACVACSSIRWAGMLLYELALSRCAAAARMHTRRRTHVLALQACAL